MNINAVGIDVSKGKSMVAILRPYGEVISSPFEIKHTFGNIKSLVKQIKSMEGESFIVMEHTGHYYEPLARELSLAGLFVTAVNLMLIKDFGDNSLRKVKSDKADAVKIARYTLDSWTELKQYSLLCKSERISSVSSRIIIITSFQTSGYRSISCTLNPFNKNLMNFSISY